MGKDKETIFKEKIEKIQEATKDGGCVLYLIEYKKKWFTIDVFDYKWFNKIIEKYSKEKPDKLYTVTKIALEMGEHISKEKLDNFSSPNGEIKLIIGMRNREGKQFCS